MNAEAHGTTVEYHDARELLNGFRLDFLSYSEFKSVQGWAISVSPTSPS